MLLGWKNKRGVCGFVEEEILVVKRSNMVSSEVGVSNEDNLF